jgi:hypothetical protein
LAHERGIDEAVARHDRHRLEHTRIADAPTHELLEDHVAAEG